MKVTICSYDFQHDVGGPNVWLKRVVPAFMQSGITPTCLFFTFGNGPQGSTQTELEKQGCRCFFIPAPKYTEDRVRWILGQLRRNPPDIFVANTVAAANFATKWLREASIPVVGVIHSDDLFHHGLIRDFAAGPFDYRWSAAVAVSRKLKDDIQWQSDGIRTEIIPCGVPVPTKLSIFSAEQPFRLVYVGRLEQEQKRIWEVAQVLCRIVREVPNCEAFIYGTGSQYSGLQRYLMGQGAGLRVYLGGAVANEQIQHHLSRCHAFVMLSDYEGIPISLMEAMSCGCVPICFRIASGIPELIEDGVTGYLVDDRSDAVVEAVRKLRTDERLWQQISENARAKIEAEYSLSVCAQRWVELFHDLHNPDLPSRQIKIPRHFDLPPVDPDIARPSGIDDTRAPKTVGARLLRAWAPCARLLRKMAKAALPYGLVRTYQIGRYERDQLDPSLWIMPKREFLLPQCLVQDVVPYMSIGLIEYPAAQVRAENVDMIMPPTEYVLIMALVKALKPKRIFEIGTYTGSTTMAMASNAGADARIFTLDYNIYASSDFENSYEVGACFRDLPDSGRITQLHGNSVEFDFSAYEASMDLILVDGDHRYPAVISDTKNAFRMLRPGGVIIWDDYIWEPRHPECAGVAQHLHEIMNDKQIYRIAGTRLAFYREPTCCS